MKEVMGNMEDVWQPQSRVINVKVMPVKQVIVELINKSLSMH
jgi:hypothetical protein